MQTVVTKLALLAAVSGLATVPATALAAGGSGCAKAAKLARASCKLAAAADLNLEAGKCVQSSGSRSALRECRTDAAGGAREGKDGCRDQYDARIELCEALDEDTYAPALDPARFVETIDNPFAPFVPGSRWAYEQATDEGLERVEVEVTHETKSILGIAATVVRDRGFLNGELVEDTSDWLAQDDAGNVWYLGELSYTVEDGVIVGLEGSWQAGVDGAKPGLWMEASPQVGDVYRQELLLGEAEDYGEVLGLGVTETVPTGTYTGCLRTRDASPLEPDAVENKVYAPGVGLVVEIDVATGARSELVELDLP